jgi:signal transduction histidine kinase
MEKENLKDIVSEVADQQKRLAEKKGLSLELSVGDGNFEVMADKMQLAQAVKNLIDNAINYTLHGEIKATLEARRDRVIFAVKDNGVGLSDELKPRLFTEGGRDKDSVKININSTGFGLSFVKEVVLAHKGRVWAESEGRDKGSTFYMELPLNS